MCQAEAYKFLKENKDKWFLTKEVGEGVNLQPGTVSANLSRLYEQGLILREIKEKSVSYSWKFLK